MWSQVVGTDKDCGVVSQVNFKEANDTELGRVNFLGYNVQRDRCSKMGLHHCSLSATVSFIYHPETQAQEREVVKLEWITATLKPPPDNFE